MAKTTSEIIAENVKRQKIEQELADAMIKRDEENADQIAENQARTQAILDGTSDKLVKDAAPATIQDVTVMPPILSYSLLYGVGGFILGCLVMFSFLSIKIKHIQRDCETRIAEARASIDRMLIIASKKENGQN